MLSGVVPTYLYCLMAVLQHRTGVCDKGLVGGTQGQGDGPLRLAGQLQRQAFQGQRTF